MDDRWRKLTDNSTSVLVSLTRFFPLIEIPVCRSTTMGKLARCLLLLLLLSWKGSDLQVSVCCCLLVYGGGEGENPTAGVWLAGYGATVRLVYFGNTYTHTQRESWRTLIHFKNSMLEMNKPPSLCCLSFLSVLSVLSVLSCVGYFLKCNPL